MVSERWYYAKRGERFGPLKFEQIQSLFSSGKLSSGTLVWTEVMDDWRPAHETGRFRFPIPSQRDARVASRMTSGSPTAVMSTVNRAEARPWVRFCARWVDINICGVVLGLIFPLYYLNMYATSFITILVWVFLEAALLATWGTTIGRAILGVRVCDQQGERVIFQTALSRSLGIWVKGMGLGIPLAMQILWIVGYVKLTRDGIAPWDRDAGTCVTHAPLTLGRIIGAVVVIAVLVFLNIVGMMALAGKL